MYAAILGVENDAAVKNNVSQHKSISQCLGIVLVCFNVKWAGFSKDFLSYCLNHLWYHSRC